jgi:ribosome-binding factor A
MSQRTERINELLRQEITAVLTREVSDPRIGFVTLTDVETAPDLRHARVWVSVIGGKSERDETLAALNRAMVFVRRELGTRLRLKRIPELHVRLDDTAERGTRVLQLLHELEEGRLPEEVPPPGELLPTPAPRLPHEGDAPVEPARWDESSPERGRGHGRREEGAERGTRSTRGTPPRPAGQRQRRTRKSR